LANLFDLYVYLLELRLHLICQEVLWVYLEQDYLLLLEFISTNFFIANPKGFESQYNLFGKLKRVDIEAIDYETMQTWKNCKNTSYNLIN
jgi:hypothetical protein